jgi:hypothetical protein
MSDKPDWKLKPAEEVCEAALELLREVRDEFHGDLRSQEIELWFWAEAPVTAGRQKLGKASLPNQREQITRGVDGIITCAWDWWQTATDEQRRWLLDHELSHFDLKDPDDPDKGLCIVHHDLEEFVCVYQRHGAVLEGMQRFEAAAQGHLPGMEEEVAGDGHDDIGLTFSAAGHEPVHTTVGALGKVADRVHRAAAAAG